MKMITLPVSNRYWPPSGPFKLISCNALCMRLIMKSIWNLQSARNTTATFGNGALRWDHRALILLEFTIIICISYWFVSGSFHVDGYDEL